MKKMNKAMIAALAAALTVTAAGSTAVSAAQDTKILYHTFNTAPYVTLDPSTEYSNGIMVLQNVYETLTHYNPETGEVDPMLATEWTKNEDGTVWTFQIRDDVTFHDGTPLTAQQVVNSFQRSMDVGRILRTFKIKKNVEVTDNGKIII